jgi:L-lactate dehydrogenase (cytochrome)
MVKRQFPNPIELAELMKFKRPTMNPTDRRLEKALTISDLRTIAMRRTPKAPFDYTEGAAEGELSLARARQAFEDVEFHPSILRNVPVVDTSTTVLGGQSSMPFGIAPTGFTRMMQTEGEIAGAGAAGAAGIPFTLSTLGTTSIEAVKAENPNGRNWFQLYVMKDREVSYNLVRRAAAAGFDTLFFTVDTPVAGARHRDKRNGFSIPPQLTPGTVINALPRPAWWINFLTTPKLEFASLSSTGGTVGELLNDAMDPTISFDDLAIIRSMWPGKLVVKGVQTVEDATLLADLGVDGVVLSNHGGRQLDRAPIPFHLLPSVAREVGADMEVQIDTGIMNGADIVASIALGADFTLIGRAYLYGLMAGGRRGVDKTISILRTEIERTMKLLEVSTLAELGPQHVTQLTRLAPIPRAVADAAAATAESKPRTVRTPKAAPAAKAAAPAAAKTAASKAAPKAAPKATAATTAEATPAVKAAAAAKAPAKKAAPKAAPAKKAPAKTAAATTKTAATRTATASATPTE